MGKLLCLILLLNFGVFTSNEHNVGAMHVRSSLDIVFLNSKGENLLNESTPGHFSFAEMKLFFIKGKEKVEVNNPRLDSPKGINVINEQKDLIRLRVLANVGYLEDIISDNGKFKTGKSIALLQVNNKVTDTIKTQWESGPQYLLITKAWYNDKLVYDTSLKLNSMKYGDGFTITK